VPNIAAVRATRWATAAAVLAFAVVPGVAFARKHREHAPKNMKRPTVRGRAVRGALMTASRGRWTHRPKSYAYRWELCNRRGRGCKRQPRPRTARRSRSHGHGRADTYRLGVHDVGHTVRVVVTARNAGGSTTVTSGPSRAVAKLTRRHRPTTPPGATGGNPRSSPTRPGAAVVGPAGEPAVTCTRVISVGAGVQSALAAAAPGQVVCLNAGSWPKQTINGVTPASPGVTLAAKPGADVSMDGLDTRGQTNNLTVEGIKFSGGVHVLAGANNLTVRYSSFQNFDDYAVQGCSVCVNSGPTIIGLHVLYNQIDHVAYCLRGTGAMANWTFSHNVCGPDIGYGGSSDDHYTQTEGIDGLTMDNNAFEGPFDSVALAAGAHNNVMHSCGSNMEFSNNIVWHADSRAQTILWGDDCRVQTARANNNLFVEDPRCGSVCPTVSLWAEGGDGVTFNNNTISTNTGPPAGGIFVRSGVTNLVMQNNISVGNNGGDGDFSSDNCTCAGNVAQDGSGDIKWTPHWQNSGWTPDNGSPWNPPPSSYYKPSGSSASAGYQGSIGP
jgi:hypothetical protein